MSITPTDSVKRLPPNGSATIIAGALFSNTFGDEGGAATKATFTSPRRFAVDTQNNLYIFYNDRVRKIDAGRTINTVAGGGSTSAANGVPALSLNITSPSFQNGLTLDSAGTIYIAPSSQNFVYKVSGGVVTMLGGNGQSATNVPLGDGGAALSRNASAPAAARIRKISNGVITTVADGGSTLLAGYTGPATNVNLALAGPIGIAVGTVYFAGNASDLWKLTPDSAPPPASNTPTIASGGVVNGATFQSGVSAGSWFTIQGQNLSTVTDTWDNRT